MNTRIYFNIPSALTIVPGLYTHSLMAKTIKHTYTSNSDPPSLFSFTHSFIILCLFLDFVFILLFVTTQRQTWELTSLGENL